MIIPMGNSWTGFRFWVWIVGHILLDGLIVGAALYLFLIFRNDYPKLSCLGTGISAALFWRVFMGRL